MAERAWRPAGPLKTNMNARKDKIGSRSVERDTSKGRSGGPLREQFDGYNSMESIAYEDYAAIPQQEPVFDESTVAKITNIVVETLRNNPEILREATRSQQEFLPSKSSRLPKIAPEKTNGISGNPPGGSKLKYSLRDPNQNKTVNTVKKQPNETDESLPKRESFTSEAKEQLRELYSEQLDDLKKKYSSVKKPSGNLSTIQISQVEDRLPSVRKDQPELKQSPRYRASERTRGASTQGKQRLPTLSTQRREKSVDHSGLGTDELPTYYVVAQTKRPVHAVHATNATAGANTKRGKREADDRHSEYKFLDAGDHKIHRYLPHEPAGPGILLLPKPEPSIDTALPLGPKYFSVNLKLSSNSAPSFHAKAKIAKGQLLPTKDRPRNKDDLKKCVEKPDKAFPDGYDDPLPILSMLQKIFNKACENEADRYVKTHGEERDDAREFLDDIFDWALRGDWSKYKEEQKQRAEEGFVDFGVGDTDRKYSYYVSVFPNPMKASLHKNYLVMQPLPALSLRPKLLESSSHPLSLQKTKAISLVPSRTIDDTAQNFHRNPSRITRQRNDPSDPEDLNRELNEYREPNIDRYINNSSRPVAAVDAHEPRITMSYNYQPQTRTSVRQQEPVIERGRYRDEPEAYQHRQTGQFAGIEMSHSQGVETQIRDPLASPKKVPAGQLSVSMKPSTQIASTAAYSQQPPQPSAYQVPSRLLARPVGPVVDISNVMTSAEQQRLLGRERPTAPQLQSNEASGMSIGYNPSIGKVARGTQDLDEIRQLRAEIRELRKIQAQQDTGKSRSVSKSPSLLFVTERDREVAEFYQLEPPKPSRPGQDDEGPISFPYHKPGAAYVQPKDYKSIKTPEHVFNQMYGQRTHFFGDEKGMALQTASDGFKGAGEEDKGSYISQPVRDKNRLKSAKVNNGEIILRAQTNIELSLEAKIFKNGGPPRAIAGQLHLAEKFFYENVKNEARMIDHNEPDKTIPANETRDGIPLDTMLELSRASFVCRDGVLIYLQFSYKPRMGFEGTPHLHGRKYFCRGFEREIDEAKRVATAMPDEIEVPSNAGGFPTIKNVHIEDYIYTVGKVVLLNYVFETVEVHYRARSNLLTKIIFQSVQGQRIVIGEPENDEYPDPFSTPGNKGASPRGQDTLVSRTTFMGLEKVAFVSAGFDCR